MTDVSIVVGTLDLYKAVWPLLCHSLNRYWSDCPWPVQFITNHLDSSCGMSIKVGGDHTQWSRRMIRGLKRIESPIILWLTSDNWLTDPVDTAALIDFAEYIEKGKAGHIRLYPGWNHDIAVGEFKHDSRLMVFADRSPYRASLKPGFWKRRIFLDLLVKGESPWDFERNASKRSRKYRGRFFAIKEWGCFPFVTETHPSGEWVKSPIAKGRWTKAAKAYCKREGLKIDFQKHPVSKNPFGNDVPAWVLP